MPFEVAAGHYLVRAVVKRQAYLGRLFLAIDGHSLARRLRTGAERDPEITWLGNREADRAAGHHWLEIAASGGMVALRAIALDRTASPAEAPGRAAAVSGAGSGRPQEDR